MIQTYNPDEVVYSLPFLTRVVVQNGGHIKSSLIEQFRDPEDPDDPRPKAAADAVESFILALACEGVDVTSPRFGRALHTAVESIVQNAFEGEWMPTTRGPKP